MREYNDYDYSDGVRLLGRIRQVIGPSQFELVENGIRYDCKYDRPWSLSDLLELNVGEKYLVTGKLIGKNAEGIEQISLFYSPITLAEAMEKKRKREEKYGGRRTSYHPASAKYPAKSSKETELPIQSHMGFW